jgi:hypothetical protein
MAALVQIVKIINVFARTTELQEETHHTQRKGVRGTSAISEPGNSTEEKRSRTWLLQLFNRPLTPRTCTRCLP